MRYRLRTIGAFAFLAVITVLSTSASAQWGWGRGEDYHLRNMRSASASLRDRSWSFRQTMEREVRDSVYRGTREEAYLMRMAKSFSNAVNDMDRSLYGRDREKVERNVKRVLQMGNEMDGFLFRARLGRGIGGEWGGIRRELSNLERSYSSFSRGWDWNDRNNRGNSDWGRNNRRGFPF